MNVIRHWKKFLAVSCSHGNLALPSSLEAVLRFRDLWKPDTTIHLGDFADTAAFRSGAKGGNDESTPVEPDLQAGVDFLEKLQPQIIFCGNHEDRLYKLADSASAIVSALSCRIIEDFEATARKLNAELIQWDYKAYRMLGDFKFLHGYYYNEMACRDHAEAFGNCIFGHTHKAGLAKGRRIDNPTGICVGTLTDIPNMDYAKSRRATLGWSGGFCWGQYCDDRAVAWLHEQPQGQTEWVLPI